MLFDKTNVCGYKLENSMWLFGGRVAISEVLRLLKTRVLEKKRKKSYCCGFIVISFFRAIYFTKGIHSRTDYGFFGFIF